MRDSEGKATAIPASTGLALLMAVVMTGVTVAGCAMPARAPTTAEQTDGFQHYRNSRYDYELDYPAAYDMASPPANGDGRTLHGPDTTLRVFGVQMLDKSLRDIAAAHIGDGANASEVQNSQGRVVMVQEGPRASRTVKAIALTGDRAAVLVIDGPMANATQRDHVLASFRSIRERAGATDAGERYTDAELGFSIVHPRGARSSREDENRVKFTVLGPANEAASEITDGYSVTVQRDRSRPETLATYARQQRPGDAVSVESVRVGTHRALRYRSTSELGQTVTHWLFMPAAGRAYHVSAVVSGSSEHYRAQVQSMLESLEFG